MADNLTTQSSTLATIPASSVISTEEITTLNAGAVSAQHIQRIAAAIRTADGTAVDLPGSTADGLLVNLGANNDITVTSGTVTISGTVTVGSHAVTNAGTFVVQENGAALTSLQLIDDVVLAEDAVHASGDKGVMALSVRKDSAVALSANGDYHPLIVDSEGRVWANANVTSIDASTNLASVGGLVSHDAAGGSVKPVLVGGYASAAAPSAVSADGDAVRAWYNRLGIQAVMIISSDGITELGFSASGRVEVEASLAAATSGGYTANSYLSVGTSDDSTVISNTACQLAWFYATNTNAAVRYVKIYNKATSPGTGDTPILRLAIPGNTAGAGGTASIPLGLVFSTGLSFRMVTGVADNDGTDVAANEIILNYAYK